MMFASAAKLIQSETDIVYGCKALALKNGSEPYAAHYKEALLRVRIRILVFKETRVRIGKR